MTFDGGDFAASDATFLSQSGRISGTEKGALRVSGICRLNCFPKDRTAAIEPPLICKKSPTPDFEEKCGNSPEISKGIMAKTSMTKDT